MSRRDEFQNPGSNGAGSSNTQAQDKDQDMMLIQPYLPGQNDNNFPNSGSNNTASRRNGAQNPRNNSRGSSKNQAEGTDVVDEDMLLIQSYNNFAASEVNNAVSHRHGSQGTGNKGAGSSHNQDEDMDVGHEDMFLIPSYLTDFPAQNDNNFPSIESNVPRALTANAQIQHAMQTQGPPLTEPLQNSIYGSIADPFSNGFPDISAVPPPSDNQQIFTNFDPISFFRPQSQHQSHPLRPVSQFAPEPVPVSYAHPMSINDVQALHDPMQQANEGPENESVRFDPMSFIQPATTVPGPHHTDVPVSDVPDDSDDSVQPNPVQPSLIQPPRLHRPLQPGPVRSVQQDNPAWLKVPEELTPAGIARFYATPAYSYEQIGGFKRRLNIEEKWFSASIPYCMPILTTNNQSEGMRARARAIPWRIPATVPCAELRRAVELIVPLVRRATLHLTSRFPPRMAQQLFESELDIAEKKVVMKWCNIPYAFLTNRRNRAELDKEMLELQLLFGLSKAARDRIFAELRMLHGETYVQRLRTLKQKKFAPWSINEVTIIWHIFSRNRTDEGMYDVMYEQLKGRRTHRSIMRMLEFIVYCESNPQNANPNMVDAFVEAVVPDAGPPDNPLSEVETRTLLELREYYGDQNDWAALVQNMNRFALRFEERIRELSQVQELYIKHGLDYIEADPWTPFHHHLLQDLEEEHGFDWERIGEQMGRTPHAVMARSNYLKNNPGAVGAASVASPRQRKRSPQGSSSREGRGGPKFPSKRRRKH